VGKTPLIAAVLLLTLSSAVSAQSDSVVGVGAAVGFHFASDPNVDSKPGWGLVGRLRRGTGLGFSLGMGWYTSDVRTDVNGDIVPLGTIAVRPVQGGVSYNWQFARFALTVGLVGGWSFNDIAQTPAEQKTYGEAIGMRDARVSVSDCWVARPSATFWYELHHRLGAFASFGYMWTRPTVTAYGAAGQRSEGVNLSGSVLSFGLAYGVF
jgi:hypothetical protein